MPEIVSDLVIRPAIGASEYPALVDIWRSAVRATHDFLGADDTAALAAHTLHCHAEGVFHRAGIGRGGALVIQEGVRSDQVLWIDEAPAHPVLAQYQARMESLRQSVNQALYLGLHDLEAHLAVYPPGSFYQAHLDRFRDSDLRTLTVVLYLNPPDWRDEDGGHLRFWPVDREGDSLLLQPAGGTLVTFLSDRFWHAVEPAGRTRLSVTGWFRRRPAL